MVEAKSVSVTLSLLGLLTGELRPAEVTLVEPRIVLEIDASGRPNWQFPDHSRLQRRLAPPARHRAWHRHFQGCQVGSLHRGGKSRLPCFGRFRRRSAFSDRRSHRQRRADEHRSRRGGKECCQWRRQSHDRRHPAGGWWQALLCWDRKRVQPERATDGQGVRLRRQPRGVRAGADRDGRPAATALASLARRKVQVRWSGGAFADDGLCQRLHAGPGR